MPQRSVAVSNICILFTLLVVSCAQNTPDEVEADIVRYPRLGEANRLCLDTPTPGGFQLIRKNIASNSENALVTFKYHSGMTAEQVLSFYLEWFGRNGWERTSLDKGRFGTAFLFVNYKKGQYDISIQNQNPNYENFSISCAVWEEN